MCAIKKNVYGQWSLRKKLIIVGKSSIGMPIIKARRSWDSLIFIMAMKVMFSKHFILRWHSDHRNANKKAYVYIYMHLCMRANRACNCLPCATIFHDDVIKWKHIPRYCPFVRGSHRSPVKSPHKGQWRGALIFSLICTRTNGWLNNREAGDLRRHRARYEVIVMSSGPAVCDVWWPVWRLWYQKRVSGACMIIISYIYYGMELLIPVLDTWAPSQYKDRLIYVWRFPCWR